MAQAIPAPCEKAQAEGRQGVETPHATAVLTATIFASSLAFVDGSVVNVALPTMGRSLGAGAAAMQWVVNAYLLPLSALLLLGGAAGDRFGRRRMFLAGVAVFAAASTLCAVAQSLGWLIAGRVIQGASSALLMPNSLAILGSSFEGDARGRAIGTWAAAGAAAGAIGPLVGGALVDWVSWRAIFLINLPLAAGALWLGARYVPDKRNGDTGALDWLGAGLATAGLAGLTWGLTVLSGHLKVAGGVPVIAGGLVALGLFVAVERKRKNRAMMPLALFATSSFIGLSILTLLLYGALGGLFVVVPFMLIEAGHYSATQAGAALLPLPILLATASRFMGQVATRIGPRWPLTIGPLIVAAGFALGSRMDPAASYWTSILPPLLIIAIGMAGAVAPLTTAVMASVDSQHVGTANGANSALARTGGLLATALLGAVLSQSGDALVKAASIASLVAAAMAAGAGIAALILLEGQRLKAR
ncbi:MFS transporter [Sphingomonas tabacisoli]|uniref:MFS transporter n=1 Tax=Sphingomonas tabacisoli TaxID=2249466 RepID=A0ABW4I665_9SPHN